MFAVGCWTLWRPTDAHAAGTFRLTPDVVEERDGGWRIKAFIDVRKPPSMMDVTMRFVFLKTVVFERTIVERGKEPVLTRKPLPDPVKGVVALEVHFADARGTVHPRANYEFDVKRSREFFEAGEYMVSLSGPDGDVGTPQKLVLNGNNEPVNRAPITFEAPAKKDAGTDAAPSAPVSTEVAPVGSGAPMLRPEAFERSPEEEMKTRPRGCGCTDAGGAEGGLAAVMTSIAAALAVWRRRGR